MVMIRFMEIIGTGMHETAYDPTNSLAHCWVTVRGVRGDSDAPCGGSVDQFVQGAPIMDAAVVRNAIMTRSIQLPADGRWNGGHEVKRV